MFGSGRGADPDSERIDSLIGPGVVVDGEISFTGALRVDGAVHGGITVPATTGGGTLLVGERGEIEGDVRVSHAVVGGRVAGSIYATDSVGLTENARIDGEVHYGELRLSRGAIVNGALIPLRRS